MLRLPRPLVLLVTAAGLTWALVGCTSSASVTADPSTSVSPSSSAATSAGSSPTAGPSADATAVTIDITIKDGQVQPNGEKINVTKGQTVVLNVTSDADDEIHAHTSGDGYELEVTAGKPARGQLVAADTGSYEVESHHLKKIIAILVVR